MPPDNERSRPAGGGSDEATAKSLDAERLPRLTDDSQPAMPPAVFRSVVGLTGRLVEQGLGPDDPRSHELATTIVATLDEEALRWLAAGALRDQALDWLESLVEMGAVEPDYAQAGGTSA